MATRIAHISDLHLLDLEGATVQSFLNKRVTGGANLLLKRARTHRQEIVEKALEELARADIDHLVVTGDLTNLALDSEFRLAKQLLAGFGGADRVSVVPGNHDRYTYRSAKDRAFERYFGPLIRSDCDAGATGSAFPFVKLLAGVAVIGLSSAVPTPPMFATGRIGRPQLEALARLLEQPEVAERFKVVLLHHHPVKPPYRRFDRLRRLTDAPALLAVLHDGDVDLVLHGHNHRPALTEIPKANDGSVLRIVEAGSTSTVHHGHDERAGKYNIYEVSDGTLRRIESFSYSGDSGGAGSFEPFRTIEISR